MSIFVASYISSRIVFCLLVAGIFYTCATTIQGSVPPCRCLMARLLCWSVGQRERQSPFLFLSNKHFFQMSKIPAECLNGKTIPISDRPAHDTSIATIQLPVSNPYSIPCFEDFIDEARKRFDAEKNAKNKAYSFILSRGLLSEFTEYSHDSSDECNSIEAGLEIIHKNY